MCLIEPKAITRDVAQPPKNGGRSTGGAGRSSQGNFGFDPAAWDPLFALAARIEETFHRKICRRVAEVIDLLQQVAGEAEGDAKPHQRAVEALAFCLVDALVVGSGAPDPSSSRLLQLVARHVLPADPAMGADARSHWFYLNLMRKQFHQWRAAEGLDQAIRRGLCSCTPFLRANERVTRELATELMAVLAWGERTLPGAAVPTGH